MNCACSRSSAACYRGRRLRLRQASEREERYPARTSSRRRGLRGEASAGSIQHRKGKVKKPKADSGLVSSARALSGQSGDRKRKREGDENGDRERKGGASEFRSRQPSARAGVRAMARTSARPGVRAERRAGLLEVLLHVDAEVKTALPTSLRRAVAASRGTAQSTTASRKRQA
jgi:hypothetical protein